MESAPPTHPALEPPALFLGAIIVMVGLHLVLPLAMILPPGVRWLGAAPIAAGFALNVWADGLFKRAGTTVKPFEETSSLLVTGPYAFSRNPMYLGMMLVLAGGAAALGSIVPWIVLPAFAWQVTRRYIVPEERKLTAAFGARYEEYAHRVRRWI